VVRYLPGRWRKIVWADKNHPPRPFESFADFQLKREEYLPQRVPPGQPRSRLAPHDLFWPGKGIPGVTPMLDLGTNNKLRQSGYRQLFVDRLGVRDALPSDWASWQKWSELLLARIEAGDAPNVKTVRSFYDALLRQPLPSTGANPIRQIAALNAETETGFSVVPANQAVWIDSARFDGSEIWTGLNALGFSIFPVLLDRGRGAPQRLGVSPASQKLAVEACFETAPQSRTDRLEATIRARRGALAAICQTKGQSLKALPKLKAVHDLRLRISCAGAELTECGASSFHDGDVWIINLQGEPMDAVAAAIAEPFGLHATDLKYRFARLLRAQRNEVAALLADDGIPSYRIREALLEDEEDEDSADSDQGSHSGRDDFDDNAVLKDELDADNDDNEEVSADGDRGSGGSASQDQDVGSGSAEDGSESLGGRSSGGGSKKSKNGKLVRRSLFGQGGGGSSSGSVDRRNAADAAQAAHARGLHAEAWLIRTIVQKLGPDWRYAANVRDEALRETDLVLTRGSAEWHIEIKTLSEERLYWSELERSKAADLQGRYFMALLIESELGYKVHWSFDPLVELASCGRRLEWIWKSSSEGPSLRKGWSPEPNVRWPTRRADRYVHVVRLTNEDLPRFALDGPELQILKARIGATTVDVKAKAAG
jgi:hypothetical protein